MFSRGVPVTLECACAPRSHATDSHCLWHKRLFPVLPGTPLPIPETTVLVAGKMFLMSFSLFHERLQSSRPRTLSASDLEGGT